MVEQHEFKVVVAGPFASGKSTLIRAVSMTPVVGTEQPTSGTEATTKPTTTVGMEYGTYSLADDGLVIDLNLYGVPGQERFAFMWDIVAEGMDGLVLLVDGTAPSTWAGALAVGRHFVERARPPVVVAVNRCRDGDAPVAEVETMMRPLGAEHLTCDVTDGASARAVVTAVLVRAMERLEADHVTTQLTGAT